MAEKNYDSTIMRIAGNLSSGRWSARELSELSDGEVSIVAREYVRLARAIVAEVLTADPSPVAPEEDR